MKKLGPYLLPSLLLVSFALYQANILHISVLKIKSHELKLTNLSYNWAPGGAYSGGETVSNNNYEDAHIGILPDYQKDLQSDLDRITANREQIDHINLEDLYFQSGMYKVRLCLDHKKLNYVDSSLFKKIVYLDILGQYELWNNEETELLRSSPDRKWWVQDSVIFTGWGSEQFIQNKLDEIWLAQVTESVSNYVTQYERTIETRRWAALALYYNTLKGKVSSNLIMDGIDLHRSMEYFISDKWRDKSINAAAEITARKS